MQWNEPLGNEFDDIRFLQTTERHRGESVIKTRRELHIAGGLQTDNAGVEVRTFVGGVCNSGFCLPEETRQTLEKDIYEIYKYLSDAGFTSYGRKSIKHEILSYLFFLNIPNEFLPQFDGLSELDKKILITGRNALKKKIRNAAGVGCPFDNYLYFVHDSERIHASFKDNVPADVVRRAWFDAMPMVAKTAEKIFTLNHKRTKKKVKGVNFDYLSLLMYFYIIEKKNGKILKTQKELACIWNIPLRTLKRKMSFLYKIDI